MSEGVLGTVYLIHSERPLHRASTISLGPRISRLGSRHTGRPTAAPLCAPSRPLVSVGEWLAPGSASIAISSAGSRNRNEGATGVLGAAGSTGPGRFGGNVPDSDQLYLESLERLQTDLPAAHEKLQDWLWIHADDVAVVHQHTKSTQRTADLLGFTYKTIERWEKRRELAA